MLRKVLFGASVMLVSSAAFCNVRDYASDKDFVAAFRSDAVSMARRKSEALGVSGPKARIEVGPRIATGGKFTGHYLWDAAFSTMWAVHTPRGTLPIASTLDNFYRFAEKDGYIGREFLPDGTPSWDSSHPVSFNPPMLSWAELALADSEYAEKGRLEKVYPVLKRHREAYTARFRRPDGLYFGCALGCGMDDTPRWPHEYKDPSQRAEGGIKLVETSIHERVRGMWKRWVHRVADNNTWNRQAGWIDMSGAAALDARCLAEMAERIGKKEDAEFFRSEYENLRKAINEKCWDGETGFYYDWVDNTGIVRRRHLGALWVLVSGVAPKERVARMIETLFDPEIFYRPVPLASLEKGDPDYVSEREYFKGPAWPNLNFLAIRGLLDCGFAEEAEKLARRWYNCCASLYEKTGGIYENMSSEQFERPKKRSYPDYAGHGCLTPVAIPAMFGWLPEENAQAVNVTDSGIDFRVPGGAFCRLTLEGAGMWRLRKSVDGVFSDKGAAQALSKWMGEKVCETSGFKSAEKTENGFRAFAHDGSKAVMRAKPFELAFYSPDGKKVFEINRIDPGRFSSAIGGRLLEREAVYGLGGRLDGLNKRGGEFTLYASDGYNNSSSTYMPIPLFSTTRGGGLFVNVAESMKFDFGKKEKSLWLAEVEKGALDVYFFATSKMRDVPSRYMSLTGKPTMPKPWQFGPVVCRYSPDLTVLEGPVSRVRSRVRYVGWGVKDILGKYRSLGTLPTAMILEGWQNDLWSKKPGESEERQRKMSEATSLLAKDNIRSMIWMRCGSSLSRNAPGFRPEFEVAVDVTDENGFVKIPKTFLVPDVPANGTNPDTGSKNSHRILDITNPEAWEWYVSTVWGKLVECGISGAKIDFCETIPDDNRLYGTVRIRYNWKDPSVFEGTSVHHAYPVFFVSKLCRDLSAKLGSPGSFMPLVRGGGLGSQRNPFMWAGDQERCFEKLDDQLLCVLNAGISGVPFMTYDLAGYHYPKPYDKAVGVWRKADGTFDFSRTKANAGEEPVFAKRSKILSPEKEEDVFSSGAAFSAYMPCIQTHGTVRNPYDMGERGKNAYRKMVEIHSGFASLRNDAAMRAIETGIPIVRPLVMDWQDDENTWDVFDEFLYLDDFLVVPLLKRETVRDVYLPAGVWRDEFTGEVHRAGKDGLRLRKNIRFGEVALYRRLNDADK